MHLNQILSLPLQDSEKVEKVVSIPKICLFNSFIRLVLNGNLTFNLENGELAGKPKESKASLQQEDVIRRKKPRAVFLVYKHRNKPKNKLGSKINPNICAFIYFFLVISWRRNQNRYVETI